jgi:hypothetical protein
MASAHEFPSLMDDAQFLEELDKVEGTPLPAAVHAREPQPPPPIPLRRDADRNRLRPEGAVAEVRPRMVAPPVALAAAAIEPGPAGSLVPAFVTILIGLSVGAASSALVFHDRVAWLIALWSR